MEDIFVPVSKSKDLFALESNGNFYFGKEKKEICNDVLVFGINSFGSVQTKNIVYDIDVLYRLKGIKFDSLQELASLILGDPIAQYYKDLSDKILSFQKSYFHSKINNVHYSAEELFDHSLLHDFYKERCRLIKLLYYEIKNNSEIISFYKNLLPSILALGSISQNPLNIDMGLLKSDVQESTKNIAKLIVNNKFCLKFNAVGAKTGRIGLKKNSFNIYNLPKTLRSIIVAKEGKNIVEFDFKNFQPRIAIFSTNDDNFRNKFINAEDIYAQFPGDREENKIELISWMYAKSHHSRFNKDAEPIKKLRENIYAQSKINGRILNIFDRPLFFSEEEEHVVFQNFITSIEADIILRLISSLQKDVFGASANSRIMFPFHDAIVCEISNNEMYLVDKVKDYMEQYVYDIFGAKFPVMVKCGNNFGAMNYYKGCV